MLPHSVVVSHSTRGPTKLWCLILSSWLQQPLQLYNMLPLLSCYIVAMFVYHIMQCTHPHMTKWMEKWKSFTGAIWILRTKFAVLSFIRSCWYVLWRWRCFGIRVIPFTLIFRMAVLGRVLWSKRLIIRTYIVTT